MTETELDRKQFAGRGADIAGVIQRQLDRDDLPPGIREAFTTLRDWSIDLTARWTAAMLHAEQMDSLLYGHGPGVIVAALRANLTEAQRAVVAGMLQAG